MNHGLYVVATPIGNRQDWSSRAIQVLGQVAWIAAEDTRHSRPLLQAFGIGTPLLALHQHNEHQVCARILQYLKQGLSVALISDAGTPAISDPGGRLVEATHTAGYRVCPIPGPSAVACALSVAGMPAERFVFEGFPPRRKAARQTYLKELQEESRTLVFYEASHRIQETLQDLCTVFGSHRRAVIARELTKCFETIRADELGNLNQWITADSQQCRGEFVLVIAGAPVAEKTALTPHSEQILTILLEELPAKQAVRLAVRLTGEKRNKLYAKALQWIDSRHKVGI